MRIHYLQHEPFEEIGNIALWISENGHSVSKTRLYADPLPDPSAIDSLIIMGGGMSVNDEASLPWLAPEKRFIESFIRSGKPVTGICLGAQLIADVLGAPVYRNRHREIGWFPVRLTKESSAIAALSGCPETFTPFHWHGETFSIPSGAIHFARSDGCENQGFFYGEKVCALQFHPEISEQSIRDLIHFCPNDLADGPYVQSVEAMSGSSSLIKPANEIMFRILDALHRQ